MNVMNLASENQFCRDEQRRYQVRAKGCNGLDYVEVHQADPAQNQDRTTLKVFFIGIAPEDLKPANFSIEGGVRIRDIKVTNAERVTRGSDDLDDYWRVVLDRFGDFSNYTLRIVKADAKGRPGNEPLDDFDPRYSRLSFTFKTECQSDLDCLSPTSCLPAKYAAPEINYLAKDYASFRQLILDRLAVLMPGWTERHVPDLGITLVELLAYVGDYLSYYQDAVATEAYLDTARQRISVRRHTRLVDYALHEGCNARAWVAIETDEDDSFDPRDLYLITGFNDVLRADRVVLNEDDLRNVPANTYEVFEPLDQRTSIKVFKAHNEMKFYTWGDRECCLPRGATRATLMYQWKFESEPQDPYKQEPQYAYYPPPAYSPTPAKPEIKLFLEPGDVLIFVEVKGAKTGAEPDADPSHRQAVRLTKVTPGIDDLTGQQIVHIEWSKTDALRFPVCISSIGSAENCCEEVTDVSVVLGNVMLVDHGRTLEGVTFTVPPEEQQDAGCETISQPRDAELRPARFNPVLEFGPVTNHEPYPRTQAIALAQARLLSELLDRVDDFGNARTKIGQLRRAETLRARADDGYMLDAQTVQELGALFGDQFAAALLPSNPALFGPASEALVQDPRLALPHVRLNEADTYWEPRRDLLDSDGNDRHFVAEIDNEGLAHLRFGNGELARVPAANARLTAVYRVGNGTAGNVGADTISHIVFRQQTSGSGLHPRNPLPARGGIEPEPMAEAKMFAPGTFRKQLERAVIADDYARLAERNHKIQRAAASLRWNGSWLEASVAIDPLSREAKDKSLRADVERYLSQYRRIGHDLRVVEARYVPLELELEICVLPHYLRGHVKAALSDIFSNRVLPDGRLGLFHPDNLTFGEDVRLSKLVAAAQAVAGVESVRVVVFKRLFEPPNNELEDGVLPLNPFEIAQLDSDPNFPEGGKLTLTMMGGR